VLSLIATGESCGLVCDSGEYITYCVPIYNNESIPNATVKMELGGRDISNYLIELLSEKGYNFSISKNKKFIDEIKENLCFIAKDYAEENKSENFKFIEKSYSLPDGENLTIGQERFKCPEILFNPQIKNINNFGINKGIYQSIQLCDPVVKQNLYKNIILTGGNTLFEGFAERLQNELKFIFDSESNFNKINVINLPNRRHLAYTGGVIVSNSENFTNKWITKEEYEEYGANIVNEKYF
jgi:hypothetical protein